MGRCHDFGVQVGTGCEHPMQAQEKSCVCPECSAVCEGQFNGCSDVWARGPRPVHLVTATPTEEPPRNGQFRSPRNAVGNYELLPDEVQLPGTEEQERVAIASAGRLSLVDPPDSSLTALRTELQVLSSAMTQQQALLKELITAFVESREPSDSPSAEQGEHAAMVKEADERLRASLKEIKASLEAAAMERASLWSAAAARISGIEAQIQDLASKVQESISELKESIAGDRRSTNELVSVAMTEALRSSEERETDRLRAAIDPVIGEVMRVVEEGEAVWTRRRQEAAEAEAGRMRELQASLAAVSDVLKGTQSLVASQLEYSELIDGGMTKLHELITELQTSTAVEHQETREELAAERRAVASLKKHLRPVTESLPELIAAAVQESSEGTVARFERALDKLRRSVQAQPEAGRHRQQPAKGDRRATAR